MSWKLMTIPALAGLAAAFALGAAPANAQDFPSEPVTMIVPFSTGGGNDTVARLMGQHIEDQLGARMVVENLPGAGGQIGWTRLAGEENDGHTIGMISSPSIFLVELLRDNVDFSLDDFQAIASIQSDPILLAVSANGSLDSYDALLAALNEDPGAVNLGGDGPQSNVHLQAVALEDALGVDANFIPYAGSGPAAEALLGNEVDAALLSTSSAIPFIEAGRLRPLAVISDERHPALPDVPTLSEVSGTEVPAVGTAIRGVIAPAGVPAERVAHLEQAFEQMLADEAFAAQAKDIGIVTRYMGSEEFGALLTDLRARAEQYAEMME